MVSFFGESDWMLSLYDRLASPRPFLNIALWKVFLHLDLVVEAVGRGGTFLSGQRGDNRIRRYKVEVRAFKLNFQD